jgi:hypothetical protein
MKLCHFDAGLCAAGRSRGPAQRGCDPAGTRVEATKVLANAKEIAQ